METIANYLYKYGTYYKVQKWSMYNLAYLIYPTSDCRYDNCHLNSIDKEITRFVISILSNNPHFCSCAFF